MPYVERSIDIKAPIQQVYELAKDMERYPEFMPDVELVKVVERTLNRTITDWQTSVEGTPILWTEEDLFDDENHRIRYKLIEGDLEKFEGEWIFEETEGGTKVTLTVDYVFGIPEMASLIGPTLFEKVCENSEMMLAGINKMLEDINQPIESQ